MRDLILFIAIAFVALVIIWAWPPALQEEYQLDRQGWKSTIVLHKDGSFDQVARYRDGKAYRISGKWKRTANALDFYPFLWLVDMDSSSWNSTAGEVFSATAGIVSGYLVIREESGYVYNAVE